jgi:hypothetical protein
MLEVFVLLALVSLMVVASLGALLFSVVQATSGSTATMPTAIASPTGLASKTTPTPAISPTPTSNAPFFLPNNAPISVLTLPAGHTLIYEENSGLYMLSGAGETPQRLSTPGYLYNEAVRPILTPEGQLLYSGPGGIWLMNIFTGTVTQVATLAHNQAITALALSSDGTTIAWSTQATNGNGAIDIFAGPLAAPVKVFTQAAAHCPCFRIFGFLNSEGQQGNETILLTDSQQSYEAIQYGLWSLDLTAPPLTAQPTLLLPENTSQGPLALAPYTNTLLYSSYEGDIPVPTDGSVPNDIGTLTYPNSLDATTLDGRPLKMDGAQTILPEQHDLPNSAEYHWITTPIFTPDGKNIIYVEFSSLSQQPFDRSNAIFIAPVSGAGKSLRIGQSQLLLTSTARLVELDGWFSNNILTFYADNELYALNIQHNTIAALVHTYTYARVIGSVGTGNV